jgi:type IV secretion system protein VirD4
MYRLCRLALIVATIEFVCASAIWVSCVGVWGLVAIAIAALAQVARRGKNALWAHGTSRWATESDLRKAGMIDSDRGLMVGRLAGYKRPTVQQVTPILFDPRVSSKSACDQYARMFSRAKKGPLVRLSKTIHSCVCIPSGGGKGASFLIPWLLERDESAFVFDVGGSLAKAAASHREKKFRQRIACLDPYHVFTNHPDGLNPLDAIAKGARDAIDCCRGIAQETVVRTGREADSHWNDTSEMAIGAASIAVVEHGRSDDRSLQTVLNIVSSPEKFELMKELLRRSEGLLPRLGDQLSHFRDRELASVITTTLRHMSFLSTPAIVESTSSSSFDPADLRGGKLTIFCILPPDRIRDQRGLLRLWLGTIIRAVIRGGRQDA